MPNRLLCLSKGCAARGVFTLLAAISSAVDAHETWIMPPTFSAPAGTALDVQLTSGKLFPEPEFNTASDDVIYARLRQGARVVDLKQRDTQPKVLRLRGPALQPGTAIVYALLPPAEVTLSPTQIAEYFDEIRASPEVRAQWAAQRRQQATWVESFTKQAKTCIRVGTTLDQGCNRAIGLPLEIVPLDPVFGITSGQTIRVRLTWQGKPLVGASVGHIVESHAERHFATTDANGVAAIIINAPGRVMIFSIYLRALKQLGAWQSDFTTLTLQVEPRGAP